VSRKRKPYPRGKKWSGLSSFLKEKREKKKKKVKWRAGSLEDAGNKKGECRLKKKGRAFYYEKKGEGKPREKSLLSPREGGGKEGGKIRRLCPGREE